MGDLSETEDDQFFDSREEVSSVSDSCSNYSKDYLNSGLEFYNSALGYDFWTKRPDSVDERRAKFLKWMGLNSDWHIIDRDENEEDFHVKMGVDKLRNNSEYMPENSDSKPQVFSSHSLEVFQLCDTTNLVENEATNGNSTWKIKNSDPNYGIEVNMENQEFATFDDFEKSLDLSRLVRRLLRKDPKGYTIIDKLKNLRGDWLRKFIPMAQIAEKLKKVLDKRNEIDSTTRKIRVHVCKKNLKELSSLYNGQEFPAHKGSILAMKFSPDGRHLASAGEDGVVRVWKVLEDEIAKKIDVRETDLYFSLNHFSDITPLNQSLRKTSDSACVVLPQKVFQLLEKPLHEFYGHEGEVLSISWSKNGHLLSSSVDKTARLWRLGHDHCLGVYTHNNYVTCVEFNPVDNDYFVSGSIDGKIRIWDIQYCRVVDWSDIREMITAVCYSPDGKGGIVGSMDGNCRFFDIIDNQLELGAQICLDGKKKTTGKRITGFQFCPSDISKVIVTSADSQVRILCGTNVVGKFKGGTRSSSTQGTASFTSDGEHIISATDNSNIHVWNFKSHDKKKSSRPKNLISHENFSSPNASIAVPWCGFKDKIGSLPNILGNGQHFDENFLQKFPDYLTSGFGLFLDALHKGSATWPEEKLAQSRPVTILSSMCKSEFKFLKNAWINALNSTPHLWGLVVVTGGWDGCIRTFLNYGLPIRF